MAAGGKAVRRLVVGLLRAYQYAVSPFFGPCCRFHPSCSEYLVGAVTTHGVLRGLVLGCRRVAKCHPWHPGGVDPVPEPNRKD
ncbi:MAG: membrane protein insertion efficiency factor YidD [Ectothiorhodospiraceae bacterium]